MEAEAVPAKGLAGDQAAGMVRTWHRTKNSRLPEVWANWRAQSAG